MQTHETHVDSSDTPRGTHATSCSLLATHLIGREAQAECGCDEDEYVRPAQVRCKDRRHQLVAQRALHMSCWHFSEDPMGGSHKKNPPEQRITQRL